MAVSRDVPKQALLPLTAGVNEEGHLTIGGCDCVALAGEYGTPLYVFDEAGVRSQCRQFIGDFGERYPQTTVIYACKAFTSRALLRVLREEGLGLDVVSGGEMAIAHAADFPLDKCYFHGNNKSAEELRTALEWGVGRIVVDNLQELALLGELAGEYGRKPDILLRLTPGIDPHTHQYNTTGTVDSKFGFPRATWEDAFSLAMMAPGLNLIGIHFHLGSSIFELEPFRQGIEVALEFAAEMKKQFDFELQELDIGGGYAVQYVTETPAPPISAYADAVAESLISGCDRLGLSRPGLVIEPGRSIVGRSCVALYTAGVVKEIPGVRCYVSMDGGMADNIRPPLYGARHEAVVAGKMRERDRAVISIAGKFCESGDILIRDIKLPPVASGDILAIADCGAYCLPLGNNYNASLKPAVVMVKDGKARLIRRRESFEDLIRNDMV
jgi:diaminopimelate decarboxylase